MFQYINGSRFCYFKTSNRMEKNLSMIRFNEFSSTKTLLLIKSNLSHKFSQTFNRFQRHLIINQNIKYKLNTYIFTNLYNINHKLKTKINGA